MKDEKEKTKKGNRSVKKSKETVNEQDNKDDNEKKKSIKSNDDDSVQINVNFHLKNGNTATTRERAVEKEVGSGKTVHKETETVQTNSSLKEIVEKKEGRRVDESQSDEVEDAKKAEAGDSFISTDTDKILLGILVSCIH